VTVEYLGHIRNIIGSKRTEEIEIENNSSVADLLVVLSKKYGIPFKKAIYESGGSDVKSNFMATVNGYLLNQLKGVETKLKDGDCVILMPVVSGG
jgi:molybdopterin synthase sulfur carrier subunit